MISFFLEKVDNCKPVDDAGGVAGHPVAKGGGQEGDEGGHEHGQVPADREQGRPFESHPLVQVT